MLWERYRFVRSLLTLGVGTSFAQLIPILFYPVLSRLYTPSEFGDLALVVALYGALAYLLDLQYERGILIQETQRNLFNYVILCVWLALVMAVLLFPILTLLWYVGVFPSSISFLWIVFIVVNGLLYTLYNIHIEWCVRERFFRSVSVQRFSNATTTSLFKLGFAYCPSLKSGGLIYGDLLSRLFVALMAIGHFVHKQHKYWSLFSRKRMFALLYRYREYPKYWVLGTFLYDLAPVVFLILFMRRFGNSDAGHYSMALLLLSVPITLLGKALSDAFRSQAQELYRASGSCAVFYRRTMRFFLPLTVLMSLAGYFLLPLVIPYILGSQWLLASKLSAILALGLLLQIASMIAATLWVITHRHREQLFFQLFYFLFYVVPPCCVMFFGCDTTVTIWTLAVSLLSYHIVLILRGYILAK